MSSYDLTGTNMKLESGSDGKPESSPHVSSESKMPESGNANSTGSSSSSASNGSGVCASTKPATGASTQQADMKLPTEAGKEENTIPTSE
jgi:hypothetical protein